MEITQAQDSDINEIISLLKISLGEALMPKSEAYFIWKHFKNPFGKSLILLAKENGKIIGIRAFMLWSWINVETIVTSVRAVDTATHPDYQGKGVFKKLTLEAVKKSIDEKFSFVFNTPNPISMIGYLKIG
jgi:GNAT superfamily N-acetyltransferase